MEGGIQFSKQPFKRMNGDLKEQLGNSMCQNWNATHQKQLSSDASLTDVACLN